MIIHALLSKRYGVSFPKSKTDVGLEYTSYGENKFKLQSSITLGKDKTFENVGEKLNSFFEKSKKYFDANDLTFFKVLLENADKSLGYAIKFDTKGITLASLITIDAKHLSIVYQKYSKTAYGFQIALTDTASLKLAFSSSKLSGDFYFNLKKKDNKFEATVTGYTNFHLGNSAAEKRVTISTGIMQQGNNNVAYALLRSEEGITISDLVSLVTPDSIAIPPQLNAVSINDFAVLKSSNEIAIKLKTTIDINSYKFKTNLTLAYSNKEDKKIVAFTGKLNFHLGNEEKSFGVIATFYYTKTANDKDVNITFKTQKEEPVTIRKIIESSNNESSEIPNILKNIQFTSFSLAYHKANDKPTDLEINFIGGSRSGSDSDSDNTKVSDGNSINISFLTMKTDAKCFHFTGELRSVVSLPFLSDKNAISKTFLEVFIPKKTGATTTIHLVSEFNVGSQKFAVKYQSIDDGNREFNGGWETKNPDNGLKISNICKVLGILSIPKGLDVISLNKVAFSYKEKTKTFSFLGEINGGKGKLFLVARKEKKGDKKWNFVLSAEYSSFTELTNHTTALSMEGINLPEGKVSLVYAGVDLEKFELPNLPALDSKKVKNVDVKQPVFIGKSISIKKGLYVIAKASNITLPKIGQIKPNIDEFYLKASLFSSEAECKIVSTTTTKKKVDIEIAGNITLKHGNSSSHIAVSGLYNKAIIDFNGELTFKTQTKLSDLLKGILPNGLSLPTELEEIEFKRLNLRYKKEDGKPVIFCLGFEVNSTTKLGGFASIHTKKLSVEYANEVWTINCEGALNLIEDSTTSNTYKSTLIGVLVFQLKSGDNQVKFISSNDSDTSFDLEWKLNKGIFIGSINGILLSISLKSGIVFIEILNKNNTAYNVNALLNVISEDIPSFLPNDLTINPKWIFLYKGKKGELVVATSLGLNIDFSRLISNLPIPLSANNLAVFKGSGIKALNLGFVKGEPDKKELHKQIANEEVKHDVASWLGISKEENENQSQKIASGPIFSPDIIFPDLIQSLFEEENLALSSGKKESVTVTSISDSSIAPEKGKLWKTVNKNIGPINISRIGLSWKLGDPIVGQLLLDMYIQLGPVQFALLGAGVEITVNRGISYKPVLTGVGIAAKMGPVTLIGVLLKDENAYNGAILIKVSKVFIFGLGSYTTIDGSPSFMTYAVAGFKPGIPLGPTPINLTGIALGFGYNRSVKMPTIHELETFPLLTAARDPKDLKLEDVVKTTQDLSKYFVPKSGNYFLAIGAKFNISKIVDIFLLALLRIEESIKFNVMGYVSLEYPEKKGNTKPYISILAFFDFTYDIKEGAIKFNASIGKGSYIIDPKFVLSGDLALYSWLSGDHVGDFVMCIGGYHSAFNIPAHYPQNINRIRVSYKNNGAKVDLSLYLALTPLAFMFGGKLEVSYKKGCISAGLDFDFNALIAWQPFYYQVNIIAEIRGEIRFDIEIKVNLLFKTFRKRLSISKKVSTHARISLSGPNLRGVVTASFLGHDIHFSFGENKNQAIETLSWLAFKKSFIKENVFTYSPTNGVIGEIITGKDAKKEKIVVVRPDDFAFEIKTFFPVSKIGNLSGVQVKNTTNHKYKSFGISPMGKKDVTSELDIVTLLNGKIVEPLFNIVPITSNAPAALWSGNLKANISHDPLVKDLTMAFKLTTIEKEKGELTSFLIEPDESVDPDKLVWRDINDFNTIVGPEKIDGYEQKLKAWL